MIFSSCIYSSCIPEDVKNELEEIIDNFVGDEEDIIKNDGLTAFQMSGASHIEGCKGAFNMAVSYEIQKKSHGVTKDMKVENVAKYPQWMKQRSRLLHVRYSSLF